jgi:signal transduction histidine kinase
MENRIIALINEKDVMLGAIGHDLKTPLAALRVRIGVEDDDAERARMAQTIEEIVRSLDDILSLARVAAPARWKPPNSPRSSPPSSRITRIWASRWSWMT